MTTSNTTAKNTTVKNTTVKISRKSYAAIMTAKDDMREIITLGNKMTAENAYNTAYAMMALAAKYMCDFGDVDPLWNPSYAKKKDNNGKEI